MATVHTGQQHRALQSQCRLQNGDLQRTVEGSGCGLIEALPQPLLGGSEEDR
jgi:hypothetical protein